ncbi:MAG: carboxypeptidase regulatory-like domain-containing protein [Chloroflexi bacterium]|nr:carboxypeptidase regulatory-like domain-containing protein [Chloroflexota bacterium]MBV9600815.1 carboxypeptidase regulatory-like domain-containing protein [Chloroflexota bacterium]
MHFVFVRATALALLAGGLLMPVAASAQSVSGTGSVVGSVTCGPNEDSPAAHIVVSAPNANLQTVTDTSGRFTLDGLPAGQTFTIQASADPQGSVVASRFNVGLQPGETLDIGSMDLAICGQPQSAPTPVEDPANFNQDQ